MRKCIQYIHATIMHSSISSTCLARLMPREIHADVNAETSLVECLREIIVAPAGLIGEVKSVGSSVQEKHALFCWPPP